MKKVASLFLIFLMLFVMVGCGDDVSINGKENDLIAEYIAGVVLKYNGDGLEREQQLQIDLNSQQKPTESATQSGQQATQKPTQSATQSGGSQTGTVGGTQNGGSLTGNVDVMTELASGLGLSGTTIKYSKYSIGDKYPEDGLFSVPASDNCKVFGFEFEITNNSGADIVANTDATPIIFKLDIGGQTRVQSSSILANDMTSLKNVTIKAGEKFTAVVIFQIPLGLADDAAGMSLQVYSNGSLIGTVPGV